MRPDSCAVLLKVTLLELEGVDRASLDAFHGFPPDMQVVRVRDLEKGQRLDLFRVVAEHRGEGRIGLHNAPIEADDGDADCRVFHRPAEALLAFRDLPPIFPDAADEEIGEEKRGDCHRDRHLKAKSERFRANVQPRQKG